MDRRPIMAIVLATSLVALAGESPAAQGSVQFKSSTQHTCWEDTAGFDATLQPNPLPANPPPGSTNFIRRSHTATFFVLTFNPDGTFTSQGTSSIIRSSGPSFTETTVDCSGTFALSPDLSLATSSSCTFQETLPSSSSGTITGIQATYQAVQGVALQVSSPHPPVVETVSVTPAAGAPFTYQRLCTRAGSTGELFGQ